MPVRRLIPVLAVLGLLLSGCAVPTGEAAPTTVAGAAGCAPTVSGAAGTTTTHELAPDRRTRSYALRVPDGYQPSTPTPLILAFHGYTMSPAKLEALSGLSEGPTLVAYPQSAGTSPNNGWESAPYASGHDDVAFVRALLDDVAARHCVDPRRVFAAGLSNGGGFVSLLSCALPERIAAFAVVSGAMYPATNPPCPGATPVPIIEFHGTADTVIPYAGGRAHDAGIAPVAQWLDEQVRRNGCASPPTAASVGPDVQRQTWTGCHGRGALVHYRVDGGGHTWPGRVNEGATGPVTSSVSATDLIQDFFAAHPRE